MIMLLYADEASHGDCNVFAPNLIKNCKMYTTLMVLSIDPRY